MTSQARLVADLSAAGRLPPEWRAAFTAVDRAAFLPSRVWIRGGEGYLSVDRASDPDRWRAAAYADAPVVTRVADAGPARVAHRPTSSASMPRVVATMLDVLHAEDGMRVLEAGTGTGYNAALLCSRLGSGAVTSVEADPEVAAEARRALHHAGHTPTCLVGDGGLGHPDAAPYERLIATYAVERLPPAWAEQTRPGGVMVVPWGSGLYNGVLLRLTAGPDGTAAGRVTGDCAFMWDRGQRPAREVMDVVHAHPAGRSGTTTLDPRNVLGVEDAAFTAGLFLPGVRYSVGHGAEGEFTLWLADARSGAWACVDHEPGTRAHQVEQFGHRRLWDDVETAYQWWDGAGRPTRTRFGLSTGPHGDRPWLDTPDTPVPVPAGGPDAPAGGRTS